MGTSSVCFHCSVPLNERNCPGACSAVILMFLLVSSNSAPTFHNDPYRHTDVLQILSTVALATVCIVPEGGLTSLVADPTRNFFEWSFTCRWFMALCEYVFSEMLGHVTEKNPVHCVSSFFSNVPREYHYSVQKIRDSIGYQFYTV